MSINHSETKNSTLNFFVELNKTKTASIGVKYRIGGQIAWCGGVSTSKIYFLFTITFRLVVLKGRSFLV